MLRSDFFVPKDDARGNLPFLVPDADTAQRRYVKCPPSVKSAPLIFSNGWKEEFAARRIKEYVADVLFDATTCIVRGHLRERLVEFELPYVYFHPSVYIDDVGNPHLDFWYVGIQNYLDCWDRKTSIYDDEPLEVGAQTLYSMYSYSPDREILNRTPLQERLLFRMGGTVDGLVTCHSSIGGVFRGNGDSGAVLQSVQDFGKRPGRDFDAIP